MFKNLTLTVSLYWKVGLYSAFEKGGGNPGEWYVSKACTAENFRKIGVKSTVFELQKSYRHKSSSLINFQNNETGKNIFCPQERGGVCPFSSFWDLMSF